MIKLITSGLTNHDDQRNGCPGVWELPTPRYESTLGHPNQDAYVNDQAHHMMSLPVHVKWSSLKEDGRWYSPQGRVSLQHRDLKWFSLEGSDATPKPWYNKFSAATKVLHHNITGICLLHGEHGPVSWPAPGQPYSTRYNNQRARQVWSSESGNPGQLVATHDSNHMVYCVDHETGLPHIVEDRSFTRSGIHCPYYEGGILPGDVQTITGREYHGYQDRWTFRYAFTGATNLSQSLYYESSYCTASSYILPEGLDSFGNPYCYCDSKVKLQYEIIGIMRQGNHYYVKIRSSGHLSYFEGGAELKPIFHRDPISGTAQSGWSEDICELWPLVPQLVASFPKLDEVLDRYKKTYEPILVENAVAGHNFGTPESAARALMNNQAVGLDSNWIENWSQLPGGSEIPSLIQRAVKLLSTGGDLTEVMKLISDAYLIYKYEVSTNIADFADVQEKAGSQAFRRALLHAKRGTWRDGTYVFKPEALETKCRTTFYLRSNGDPIEALFNRLDSLGLNPLRPENLWDLIPLSFVLDWFGQYGAFFNKISESGYSEMFYTCLLRIDTVAVTQPLSISAWKDLIPNTVLMGEGNIKLFSRTHSPDFGSVSTEYLPSTNKLSTSQLLQAGALLVTSFL